MLSNTEFQFHKDEESSGDQLHNSVKVHNILDCTLKNSKYRKSYVYFTRITNLKKFIETKKKKKKFSSFIVRAIFQVLKQLYDWLLYWKVQT